MAMAIAVVTGYQRVIHFGFRGATVVIDAKKIRALVKAYGEYVELLGESESRLIGLAYVHGYRTPVEAVVKGEKLREKIVSLKNALEL